jgi:type II secretory pathway component PulJ
MSTNTHTALAALIALTMLAVLLAAAAYFLPVNHERTATPEQLEKFYCPKH